VISRPSASTVRSEPGWLLLPLRAFLAVVFVDAGVSKIADRRFLDDTSPLSMHASVEGVRHSSPIGGLLGPVAAHSAEFGVFMAAAELAVGLGILFGLFTRVAAVGGMALALSLWLTVSWGAQPWYTSADLVYLMAFTPLLIAGSGDVLSADGWLARVRVAHPGRAEDRTRRTLLAGGAAMLGALVLGGAAVFRRTRRLPEVSVAASLVQTADVPVGGATKVTDPGTDDPTWVLQLRAGQFTAFDAVCPHQGCTVDFVSAATGFSCPCHGSRFDSTGKVLNGPASRGLTAIPVVVDGQDVRTS
jgi:thiosulfate dehydrogenase [quinone] large subunit